MSPFSTSSATRGSYRSQWAVVTLIIAAICFVFLAPTPALAADVADYTRRVDEAITIAEAADAPELSVREALDVAIDVNTLLPSGETVTLDGEPIHVDQSVVRSFVARLDTGRTPENRAALVRELEAHLYSLRASLGTQGDVVSEDPAALDRLLGARAQEPNSSIQEWFAGLVDRLIEWLQGWWEPATSSTGFARLGMIIRIVISAILVVLLAWVVSLAWKWSRRSLAKRDVASAAVAEPVVAAAQDLPPDARAYAEALAAAGDERGAVRALFGGAARSLVDAGAIVQTRTRTNAELIADLTESRVALSALPRLIELSGAFERAWYGHQEPGESGWRSALDCFDAVIRSLAGGDAS